MTCKHTTKRPIPKMHCYICGTCRKVLEPKEAAYIITAFELFP